MQESSVAQAFERAQIELWGVCPFEMVKDRLLPCRAASRLPAQARSVICALFPYHTSEMAHNLSRYAFAPDYHSIVLPLLQRVAQELQHAYPKHSFACFVDNSPIPEVRAAALCGLGCVGEHGLLIHPRFGSWVFIGEIVTDLPLPAVQRELQTCLQCGACRAACPGGALQQRLFEKERCLSHLTQKKGALSEEEERLIKKGKLAWGCDVCQEVCPMNRGAEQIGMEAFQRELLPQIVPGQAAGLQGRAFCWRPPQVLERNLCILQEKSGNPKDVSKI